MHKTKLIYSSMKNVKLHRQTAFSWQDLDNGENTLVGASHEMF